jgi:hypothetical protein
VLLAGLVLGDFRFEFESDMEGSEETSPKWLNLIPSLLHFILEIMRCSPLLKTWTRFPFLRLVFRNICSGHLKLSLPVRKWLEI